MTGLSFEGEADSLSIRQQEFLREVIEGRGYTDGKVIINTLGKPGDNYVANVKRIIIEGSDGSTLKIIAKVAPTNEMARVQMQAQVMFRNEGTMYTKVLPKLKEIQKDESIPVEDHLRYAECYGVLLEEPHELILLEDLQVSNYTMLDRFVSLTNESIKLNLKNFATLHSLSMVLKKRNPEVFEDINQNLVDAFGTFGETPEFKYYFDSLEKDALSVIEGSKYQNAIRGSISKLMEQHKKLMKDQTKLKYSVVIQGDGWTNNIMFKLKDDIPVEAVMIDYQMSKVSNPVCDILYMIFNCTDYETRHAHYNDWIDYYHLQLEQSLANYGIKADFIFSRDQLDADLKRYSKFFFSTTIMLSSLLIRKSEDAAKVKEAMELDVPDMEKVAEGFQISKLDPESISRFKNRIEGLINSFCELGYIV
ncbi:uncharacterized protein ACR2FA_012826 [Aphomia sociella]